MISCRAFLGEFLRIVNSRIDRPAQPALDVAQRRGQIGECDLADDQQVHIAMGKSLRAGNGAEKESNLDL